MLNRRQRQAVEQAAAQVQDLLREAVRAVVADRDPQPARDVIAQLVGSDRSGSPSRETAATSIAVYTLLAWLTAVREDLADRPERVEAVLGWIREDLGPRYAARARYTGGTLRDADGLDEAVGYRDALRADFLPSLLWLLAGAVAVYGDGDAGWLHTPAEPVAAAPR